MFITLAPTNKIPYSNPKGQNSALDYMAVHYTEPFIITLPSSWYDLNNVERDLKYQILILFKPSLYIFVSGWVLCITLAVHRSVIRQSMMSNFCFRMTTWVNISEFSPNLVYALILWRFVLGLLIGKFCQFLSELSAHDTSVFSFLDDRVICPRYDSSGV